MSAVLKPAMRRAWPRQKLPGPIYHDFVRNEHAVDGVRKALDKIWTFESDSVRNGWIRKDRANLLNEFAIDQPAFVIDPATGQSLGYRALQGFTNSLLWNRKLDDPEWSGSATVVQDAVGLRGVEDTAWTATDNSADDQQRKEQLITVPDDTNPGANSWYIGKDNNESRFPAFEIRFQNGTTDVRELVSVNTKDGSAQEITSGGTGSGYTVKDRGTFWEVVAWAVNNGTGNTTLRYRMYPALGLTLGGVDNAATGSIVYDFGGVYLNSSIAGPPIETQGTPVSTAADDAREDAAYTGVQTEGTIEAVVTPFAAAGANNVILCLSNGFGTGACILSINTSDSFRFSVGTGSSIEFLDGPIANAWQTYTVRAVWDSGGAYLYVDGVLEASDTTFTPQPDFIATWYIGNEVGFRRWLNGAIGSWQLFKEARHP